MKQNKIYRYSYYFKKISSAYLKNLNFSVIRGRFYGPKLLINSIPKSGTNLLESVLNYFPVIRNSGMPTLKGWEKLTKRSFNILRKYPKGVFYISHFPAYQEILNLVQKQEIKVLFMVRDPRDIVISNYKYCTYIDLTHPTHKYFTNLKNDDLRLTKTIMGVPGILTPINDILNLFDQWRSFDNCLTIKFEDIIGKNGGGSNESKTECIKKISNFLNIKLSTNQIKKIVYKSSKKKSLTFRKGQIKNWVKEYKLEHIELFKRIAGNELINYGYENNFDW